MNRATHIAYIALIVVSGSLFMLKQCQLNRIHNQQLSSLKHDNKDLKSSIDSVEGLRKQKDISFNKLQSKFEVDSLALVRSIANADSFKRLYLSLNKQHEIIHRNTRNLSSDSLFMYWTELTR